MSFDGFYTRAMTDELVQHLKGGRINKIYQPFLQEIQLVIRANGNNYRLNASIHPVYYRIHLTEERSVNPEQAPMFSMILRKHIENALIQDIYQMDNDRIIIFELTGRDELGDNHHYQLIFELMGRHSNIVLINPVEQRIIDSIKHVPASINTYRTLQPGADYRYPPRNEEQINIYNLSNDALKVFAQNHRGMIESGRGHTVIQGLSKQTNLQLQAWLTQGYTAYEALMKLKTAISSPVATVISDNETMYYYAFDLNYLSGQRKVYDTLSESLDFFYKEKVRLDRIHQLSGDLIHLVKRVLERNQTKIERLHNDRRIAQDADVYKLYGELISVYAHDLQKGSEIARLMNYYNNEYIDIELDSTLSPIENSQAYYKKYAKYRDALSYIDKQLQNTQVENEYLETILLQLEQAEIEDISDIKRELREQGYISQTKRNIKERAKSNSKPRKYKASDGTMIYVGRNNHQNDELSLRKSNKNHWWMHTKNIPGAHVVIESDSPSETTLIEAAEIAAYHSRASSSSNVPVDYVQIKHLRKPNGAKPGFVIYEGQQTIYVTPSEQTVKSREFIAS